MGVSGNRFRASDSGLKRERGSTLTFSVNTDTETQRERTKDQISDFWLWHLTSKDHDPSLSDAHPSFRTSDFSRSQKLSVAYSIWTQARARATNFFSPFSEIISCTETENTVELRCVKRFINRQAALSEQKCCSQDPGNVCHCCRISCLHFCSLHTK